MEHLILDKWANLLDGREYRKEITSQEIEELKEDGLTVIFGASDDLCEFRGAYSNEIDCYNGGKFSYVKEINDFVRSNYYERNNSELITINLEERPSLNITYAPWEYTIPEGIDFRNFRIMEDGEVYGVGIVFRWSDFIKQKELKNCRNCKHLIQDKEFLEDSGEFFSILSCEKYSELWISDLDNECRDWEKFEIEE